MKNFETQFTSIKKEKILFRSWIIWSIASIFYLYEYTLRSSPSVMTQDLMRDLGVTSTSLGVLSSFYYYSYVTLQVPCGIIIDRLGPRLVIVFSALICTLGSYIFSQCQTIYEAQFGRFLLGAGSACGYLSCAKIASEWFPLSKFPLITGLTMTMGTFGGVFGGLPMAILVNTYGWRSSMLIIATIGFCIMIIAWAIVRDRPNSNSVVNSYTINRETGILEGLKEIVKEKQIWLIGFYGALMYVPLSAFAELWSIPYVMQTYNINNEIASSVNIMIFLGMGLGCPIGAYLAYVWKSHWKVMSYSAFGSMVLFTLAFYLPNLSFCNMLIILLFASFICGGQILYFSLAKELSPKYASGTAIGFTNGILMSSGIVFQPLIGGLLDLTWDGRVVDGIRFYDKSFYKISISVIPLSLFLAWIVMKFIKDVNPNNKT